MFKVNNKDTRTTPFVSVVKIEQVNVGLVGLSGISIMELFVNTAVN